MTLFAPSAPDKVRVDVWSDIACPWCYIGKRRMESALAEFAHADSVELVWHAFELDPGAPARPNATMAEILARKYGGGAARAQGMMAHVTEVAAADGLDYRFDTLKPTNTFLAHQMIHFAGLRGRQDAAKERLLRAYFTEGELVGDLETLVRLGADIGLDAGELRVALEAGTHAAAVRADEQQADALGISGVPFFVLGGKYGVSGAQDPATLLGALNQIWAETHPAPLAMLGAPDAEGCDDGSCAVPERAEAVQR